MENRENKRDIEKDIQRLLSERRDIAKKTGGLLYEQTHSFVEGNIKESISRLFQEKDKSTKLIGDLDNLQKKFLAEIEKQKTLESNIKELSKECTDRLVRFGTLLLEENPPVVSGILGELFTEYQTQKEVVGTITEKIDAERAEIEKMGFFSKILNQVKLSSASANLTVQEKKLQKFYLEAGQRAVHSAAFEEGDVSLSASLREAYTSAVELQDKLNEKKVLFEKAANEEQLISQDIDVIGPRGSFNRKKTFLEKQSLDLQASIDGLYVNLGEDFFDKKIGKDPKKVLKKTDDLDDALFTYLKDAAEIDKQNILNKKKIEYLDLEAEILSKETQKKHMQQNIIQNETQITRLQEQNESLAQRIVEAAEALDEMARKKAALLKDIS